MNKNTIIEALREISTLESDRFKSRAYLNAVYKLTAMSDEEFNERKSFLNIPGIGMSINTKIMDYKLKGILPAKLYKLRYENTSYLDPSLYKVRKGFITKRIPYDQADSLVKKITEVAVSLGIDKDEMYFLGSYRRHKKMIADIDLLLEHSQDYVTLTKNILKSDIVKVGIVSGGDQKSTFVFDNLEKTTIDISWCHRSELPFSILHFTGSAASNIRLRAKAQKMGLKLNQYGFEIIDKSDPRADEAEDNLNESIKSEEDIFKVLNEPYVEPENR